MTDTYPTTADPVLVAERDMVVIPKSERCREAFHQVIPTPWRYTIDGVVVDRATFVAAWSRSGRSWDNL